ncbi:CAMK protein kinase [Thecamonas trahens ATCC 50062]|uniref:CAMK protein kinase n=1 Tax=Thecamonas trahens ATCC 50062 TaxID=461836 RepID=A0A0L0DDK9_THETB|nr:CAMK protein kinase [Thecamonas trahens ATCC 50062]KNC50305.1 CAMK protein kinase [Thecamonas trahens ATCC 50062]|eukprot:XP_013756852.1 CAMK protein kinase [Thecamonas trahens ATCC 50062]
MRDMTRSDAEIDALISRVESIVSADGLTWVDSTEIPPAATPQSPHSPAATLLSKPASSGSDLVAAALAAAAAEDGDSSSGSDLLMLVSDDDEVEPVPRLPPAAAGTPDDDDTKSEGEVVLDEPVFLSEAQLLDDVAPFLDSLNAALPSPLTAEELSAVVDAMAETGMTQIVHMHSLTWPDALELGMSKALFAAAFTALYPTKTPSFALVTPPEPAPRPTATLPSPRDPAWKIELSQAKIEAFRPVDQFYVSFFARWFVLYYNIYPHATKREFALAQRELVAPWKVAFDPLGLGEHALSPFSVEPSARAAPGSGTPAVPGGSTPPVGPGRTADVAALGAELRSLHRSVVAALSTASGTALDDALYLLQLLNALPAMAALFADPALATSEALLARVYAPVIDGFFGPRHNFTVRRSAPVPWMSGELVPSLVIELASTRLPLLVAETATPPPASEPSVDDSSLSEAVAKLGAEMTMALTFLRRTVPASVLVDLSTRFTLFGLVIAGRRVYVYFLGYDTAGNDYVLQHYARAGLNMAIPADVLALARLMRRIHDLGVALDGWMVSSPPPLAGHAPAALAAPSLPAPSPRKMTGPPPSVLAPPRSYLQPLVPPPQPSRADASPADAEGTVNDSSSYFSTTYSSVSDSSSGAVKSQAAKFPQPANLAELRRLGYAITQTIAKHKDTVVYLAAVERVPRAAAHRATIGDLVAIKLVDRAASVRTQPREVRILRNLDGAHHTQQFVAWHVIKETSCFAVVTKYYKPVRGGPASKHEIRRYVRQVLEALAYCHQNGIIHRDIKPANVIFEAESRTAVLIDFDCSKPFNSAAPPTSEVGTPGYMAPEILDIKRGKRSRGYSYAVDIFSLGIVFGGLLFKAELKRRPTRSKLLELMANSRRRSSGHRLLRKMLEVDDSVRITALDALSEPYFLKATSWTLPPIKTWSKDYVAAHDADALREFGLQPRPRRTSRSSRSNRVSQAPASTATDRDPDPANPTGLGRGRAPLHRGFKPPTARAGAAAGRPAATGGSKADESVKKRYYAVVWRKYTRKKHKTWDGDGVLVMTGSSVTLLNDEGKQIAKSRLQGPGASMALTEGEELTFSSKEVEVMGTIAEADFLSGKAFLGGASAGLAPPLAAVPRSKAGRARKPVTDANAPGAPSSDFVTPSGSLGARGHAAARSTALYSPDTPDALVLHRDPHGGSRAGLSVVLAPKLTRILRPHQKEGVAFMYKCVMGHGGFAGSGCILADEMGLGKTITALSLVHTLLSQSEVKAARSAAEKAIVVTPSSLVKGWELEIRKWLGFTHLPPITIHHMSKKEIKAAVAEFVAGKVKNLLIISYEQFRVHAKAICKANVGLLVCDEGHRLKNAEIKTAKALLKLNTKRRIILTGTPVQNDLKEFFSVVDFVNPGILGEYPTFRRIFEEPIAKAQERNASPAVVALGKARSDELARITSQFILRRTQSMMRKYLPPKEEHVLFIKMNPLQEAIYEAFARAKLSGMASAKDLSFSWALACITTLKKICNHPALVLSRSTAAMEAAAAAGESDDDDAAEDPDDGPLVLDSLELPRELREALEDYPSLTSSTAAIVPELSSKMQVLLGLLDHLAASTTDKIVIVSNYTQTLTLIADILEARGMLFLRLDGSVPAAKRPSLVTRFNAAGDTERIFLLSAKAGGVGLNLIGANRLVMLDPDWNPATDLQAMGRVWRDGQTKRVILYRFLTTGTIEEKIWQRQIMKQGLSDVIVDDNAAKTGSFTNSELRNLFKYNANTLADTHDLIGCLCSSDGTPINGIALTQAAVDASAAAVAAVTEDSLLDSALDALDDADLTPATPVALTPPAADAAAAAAAVTASADQESEVEVWNHVEWPSAVGDLNVGTLTSSISLTPNEPSSGPRPLVSFAFTSQLESQRGKSN